MIVEIELPIEPHGGSVNRDSDFTMSAHEFNPCAVWIQKGIVLRPTTIERERLELEFTISFKCFGINVFAYNM